MNDIIREQIRNRVRQLRGGELSQKEIATLAEDIGREGITEAIPELESLLGHPDEIVRYNAIGALGNRFARTQISRIERLVEILQNDPDEDCRTRAASVLGVLYKGTKNKQIEKALCAVLRDETEEPSVRFFAFHALQNIEGMPRDKQTDPNVMRDEDIDWKFVEGLVC